MKLFLSSDENHLIILTYVLVLSFWVVCSHRNYPLNSKILAHHRCM